MCPGDPVPQLVMFAEEELRSGKNFEPFLCILSGFRIILVAVGMMFEGQFFELASDEVEVGFDGDVEGGVQLQDGEGHADLVHNGEKWWAVTEKKKSEKSH